MNVFQTLEDKKREEKARGFLESRLDCMAIDMPIFSPVDAMLVKDDKVAGVEFKFRKVPFQEYPTIWLEEAKQVALIECKEVWDKAYFMPVFNGELFRIEVGDTLGHPRTVGGRYDRQANDIDNMVDIPMSNLERMGRIW